MGYPAIKDDGRVYAVFMAFRQVSTLGIIPPPIVPSAIIFIAVPASTFSMISPSPLRTPATSVSSRNRFASIAAAIAPAAVSALTFNVSPLWTDSDGGNHWNHVRPLEDVQSMRIDPSGLTHETRVWDFFDVGVRILLSATKFRRLNEITVFAGQADGYPRAVDGSGHLLVNGSGQDHFHYFDSFRVGYPQPVHERGTNFHLFQHFADLWPPAMYNNGVNADLFQQDDVGGKQARARSSFPMAWPPYLMTTVSPAYRLMNGRASESIRAFSTAFSVRCLFSFVMARDTTSFDRNLPG